MKVVVFYKFISYARWMFYYEDANCFKDASLSWQSRVKYRLATFMIPRVFLNITPVVSLQKCSL